MRVAHPSQPFAMGTTWMIFVLCLAAVSAVTGGRRNVDGEFRSFDNLRQRRSPDGSSSNSYSSSSSSNGGWNTANMGSGGYPGASSYSGSGGFPSGYGGQGSGIFFPYQQPYAPQYDINAVFQQYLAAMYAASQGYNPQLGFPGPVSNSLGNDGYGQNVASASANIGPQGGFGEASVGDGIGLRFGGDLPAPQGGNFGTFSSSSSSSSDINGQKTSHKTATVGATDGSKVYFKTVSDP